MPELVVDKRYEGIPGVSLGGYVAALAAKDLGPSVAVTLMKAVPPGSTVILERVEAQVVLRVDDEVAATAVLSQLETTAPAKQTPRSHDIHYTFNATAKMPTEETIERPIDQILA